MNSLDREIARMIQAGCKLVPLRQYISDIEAMGFRLNRTRDCKCIARDMETGDYFPAITSNATQKATRAGFANIKADKTCEGWKAFIEYRQGHFCIVRECIFTV